MNRKWLSAVLFISAALLIGQFSTHPALAQQQRNGPGPGAGPRMSMGQFANPELVKQLKLTPVQQEKAKKISDTARKNMMALLTPAQQKAWKKMESERASSRPTMKPAPRPNANNAPQKPLVLTEKQKKAMGALNAKLRKQTYDIQTNTKLSKAEKDKRMKAANAAHMKAMAAVLTPAQRAMGGENRQNAQRAMGGGANRPGASAFRDLKLSDDQRTKLSGIYEKAQKNFRAILTKEQQKKLDTLRQNRPGGGMRPGGPPPGGMRPGGPPPGGGRGNR